MTAKKKNKTKKLKNPMQEPHPKFQDNFGAEDSVWSGEDGSVNPDEVVEQHGREHRPPLYQVLRSLISGHNPEIAPNILESKTHSIMNLIVPDKKVGSPDYDDGPLLMEIASRYHSEFYISAFKTPVARPNPAADTPNATDETPNPADDAPDATDETAKISVPIKTIARAVVSEFGRTHRGNHMPDDENYVVSLVRKFKKDKDLWLSRVTTDDRYYSPDRMAKLNMIVAGLRLLADAGVKVDVHQIRPTKRPSKKDRDETR